MRLTEISVNRSVAGGGGALVLALACGFAGFPEAARTASHSESTARLSAADRAALVEQAKLVGGNAIGAGEQGYSVAMSADGSTALVGGQYDNGNAGAAWVFTRTGSAWTQQAKLVGEGASGAAYQGFGVALSATGSTALVGGPYAGGAGAAWVFTRTGSAWTQQEELIGSDAIGGAAQGWSVALSAGASTALVGGPFDNHHIGAAWVFAPPTPGTPHPTAGSADLQVTKQAAPSDAAPGQTVEFTLTAFNRGPDDAHLATFTDTLPTGLALKTYEAAPGTSCTLSAQRLECDLGTLGVGAGEIVVAHAVVQASASGSLTNKAELSSLTPDPDLTKNTASATVTVHSGSPPTTDSYLDVTKRADKATAHVGEPVTFTVTVHNRGPGSSGPVVVSDLASGPHRILEARTASGTCSGSQPVVCHLHPLAEGQSATVRVTLLPLREGTLLNYAAAIGDLASEGKHGVNLAVRRVRILAHRAQRTPPPARHRVRAAPRANRSPKPRHSVSKCVKRRADGFSPPDGRFSSPGARVLPLTPAAGQAERH